MRVVLDTNVWVAAFISRGMCCDLLEHCVEKHEIIVSPFILEELKEKLVTKIHASVSDAKTIVADIRTIAEVIDPPLFKKQICREPDDDNILALALVSKAVCIVTGDKDILILDPFKGIPIMEPKRFWAFEPLH